MTWTLTGRGVLLWFIGFFGIIFATNAYFITVAVKTFRGEDEQLPYLQGVEYNDTLAHRALQKKLGWQASISAVRHPDGSVRVSVVLRQPDGKAPPAERLSGELRHPSDENRDQALHLMSEGSGAYHADLPKVSRGIWDVVLKSDKRDTPFEAVRRVLLK
jgi:nitrogen fixation protein FixH